MIRKISFSVFLLLSIMLVSVGEAARIILTSTEIWMHLIMWKDTCTLQELPRNFRECTGMYVLLRSFDSDDGYLLLHRAFATHYYSFRQ